MLASFIIGGIPLLFNALLIFICDFADLAGLFDKLGQSLSTPVVDRLQLLLKNLQFTIVALLLTDYLTKVPDVLSESQNND